MRVGEKHYIRDAEENLKGFFYLLVRSLPGGAPLKSSLAYFYLFFLTAILAEQQRLLLPDYVLHKKREESFQKLEIFPFLHFLSLELKSAKAGTLPLKAEIKSVQWHTTSSHIMSPHQLRQGPSVIPAQLSWQTQQPPALLPFSCWSSKTNELIPGRARDIIWQIISASKLLPSAVSLFHLPKPGNATHVLLTYK